MSRSLQFVPTIALSVLTLLTLAACNHCEKLTERICTELGEDCALWKEIGGPDKVTPQGRKVENACAQIASNELAYEGLVTSARGLVLAERLTRAAKNNDKEEMAKVQALLEENKRRMEEGLEKVKKQAGG